METAFGRTPETERADPSAATPAGPRPRPLADPLPAAPVARVIVTLAVAIAVTAAPLVGQLVSPLVGLPLAVVLGFLLADRLTRLVPAVLIFAMLFQNLFVSLLSPAIADLDGFNFIRGYTFLTTVVVWLTLVADFLLHPVNHTPRVRRFVRSGLALLMLIGAYAALGLPGNGSTTIVYTRNIVTPILLFHVAVLVAGRARLDVGRMIVVYAVLEFGLGWIEMSSRPAWLALTNGDRYWTLNGAGMMASGYWEEVLAQTGFAYRELTDFFRINLFNTPYFENIEVLRLHGPNIHAVAYGYALAFLALYLVAARRPLLALAALPLIVLASAKGALIVLLFVGFAWIAGRLIGRERTLPVVAVLLVLYAVATFVSGWRGGDYHVIGFVGGVRGFLGNPLGHGIGAGGNLSGTISIAEWSRAQEAGTFDGAVESAVGVLLYQMGFAAFAVIAWFVAAALAVWRLHARSGNLHQGLAAYGTLTVSVNGIFQEEALFSPLAMGLVLAFAGLVLGSAERVAARPPPPPPGTDGEER